MDNLKNIFNQYDEIISEIETLENESIEISNLIREKAENLKEKWQSLYDKLIEIHFVVAKTIYLLKVDENKDIIFKEALSLTPKQVLIFSEKRASVIQYKYLYPLNIRINEFAEKKAKHRDYKLFALSIVISTILGTLINFCFDKSNDQDLNNFYLDLSNKQKEILLKVEESKSNLDTINSDIEELRLDLDTLKKSNRIIKVK